MAAATPSIVFDASRAQLTDPGSGVGTADIETDSGSAVGTADIATDPGAVGIADISEDSGEVDPDPCGNDICNLEIDNDVEYKSIKGSDHYDKIKVKGAATLGISEGGAINLYEGDDYLYNENGSTITGDINMGDGNDGLYSKTGSTITGDINMGAGVDRLTNADSTITGDIDMGDGNDGLYNKTGSTITGDINMGAGVDILTHADSTITGDINMGTGGDRLHNENGSTITGDIDMGAGVDRLTNADSTIEAELIDGGEGVDSLEFHGGEIRVYPISQKVANIKNFETIDYTDGTLFINDSKYDGDPIGSYRIIDDKAEIPESLLENVILEYGDNQQLKFNGYGEEHGGVGALHKAYLKQGSLILVVEGKTSDEIKEDLNPGDGVDPLDPLDPRFGVDPDGDGIPNAEDTDDDGDGIPDSKDDGSLPGCEDDQSLCDIISDIPGEDDDASSDEEDLAADIIDEIIDGINEDDDDIDDLPIIDYGQLAKLVTSGLTPRNVDGPGQSMATYNNLLVDTVFERLPLRQFDVQEDIDVQLEEAVSVENEPDGSVLVDVEEEVLVIDDLSYLDRNSLTADYSERDGMRAWFRGFGGSSSAYQTSTLYNDYDISAGGGIVGVDVSIAKNFQLGAYANYGQINLSQNSSDIGGGSWNPSGWGGGITADWWTENFYVQGLLGGTGFSGDQKREIVSIADGWGDETATGDKSATSYLGAVRLGAPFDLGSVLLEPQLTAVWSQNNEHSFSESSVRDALQLSYKSRTTNYFQTDLGVKLAYPIKSGDSALVVPSLKLGWLHDWDQNNAAQKIGYTFTDDTVSVESNQESQNGLLVEAGVDYTVNNFGTTSFKLYGRGGLEFWDANRGTDWRASGGVTFQF